MQKEASRLMCGALPYNKRIELTARGLSRRLLAQPPRQVPSRAVRAGLPFRPCSQLIRALGATPIEPQRNNSHIALQACLEAAFIEPTNDVGLVEVFGT
jgi:hypothetical protein